MSRFNILILGTVSMDMQLSCTEWPAQNEIGRGQDYELYPCPVLADTVLALSRLQMQPMLCAQVGDDLYGKRLHKFFTSAGCDPRTLHIVEGGQTTLRLTLFDPAGNHRTLLVPGVSARGCHEALGQAFSLGPHAILIKEDTPTVLMHMAVMLAKQLRIPVFLDSWRFPSEEPLDEQAFTVLSLRADQVERAVGICPDGVERCLQAAGVLQHRTGAGYILIRLGHRGCFYYDGAHHNLTSPVGGERKDLSASDDVFLAALAVGYLQRGSVFDGAHYADLAAALTASKVGHSASIPTAEELTGYIRQRDPRFLAGGKQG